MVAIISNLFENGMIRIFRKSRNALPGDWYGGMMQTIWSADSLMKAYPLPANATDKQLEPVHCFQVLFEQISKGL